MLEKRGRRPPMKRTTSMTEFTLDLTAPSSPTNYGSSSRNNNPQDQASRFNTHHPLNGVDQRPQRRNSADFLETAQFLRLCSLCSRRLVPGHDIYMYRGDNAFCSLECRQRKISQDERKDKKSLIEAATTVSNVSTTTGEAVTAVV